MSHESVKNVHFAKQMDKISNNINKCRHSNTIPKNLLNYLSTEEKAFLVNIDDMLIYVQNLIQKKQEQNKI